VLTQNDQDYFTNCENRLSAKEAAQYLDRAKKTLAQWRYKMIGPPYAKVEEKIYYDKRILDQWLKSRTKIFWPC
jgi:hypothetical protein